MAHPVVSMDQVVKQLTTSQDGSDYGRERTWFTNAVNYSLPTISPIGQHDEQAGFQQLTSHEADMARLAFRLWGDLMNLGVSEASGDPNNAQITLAYSSNTNNETHTHHDSIGKSAAESPILVDERIWVASQWDTNQSGKIQFGSYGMQTYVHEIGHSIGLSHPGKYNATDASGHTVQLSYGNNAEYSRDTQQYTVMSYFDENSDQSGANYNSGDTHYYASTPMVDDIMAIQSKYGANMTTRTGDTVYGFNCNLPTGTTTDKLEHDLYDFSTNKHPIYTIWDAGGDDTIDASGFKDNQRIDLNAGAYSDIGGLKQNIGIAYNVTIENATGGSGNDTITGNDTHNWLEGGAGNDTLSGGGGNDTLVGGTGDDTYILGSVTVRSFIPGHYTALYDATVENAHGGIDTVEVGRSTGMLMVGHLPRFATATSYTLDTNVENGTITGSGDFDLTGNVTANKLIGNDGVNKLDGGKGDDRLTGFGGSDQFVYSDKHFGNDTITDFSAGNGSNHDVIVIDKDLCASFSALQSHMHQTTTHSELQLLHNTILDFGSDQSITLSHVSSSALTAGDFKFV